MVLQGLAGLVVFLLLAWLMGENRKHVSLKMVAVGVGVQLITGLVLAQTAGFQTIFPGAE